MTKRVISLFSLALMVISLFACGAETELSAEMPDSVAAAFTDSMSLKDVLADIANVDYYHTAKTDSLNMSDNTDEGTKTGNVYYSDGDGNVIYTFFVGYENPCFDYYTKSVSGRDIMVEYTNQAETRYAVDIKCDDYSVSLSNLNKRTAYGADYISVTIQKKNNARMSEYMTAEYSKGKWYTSSAYFYDDEGYKYYYAWYEGKELSCNIVGKHRRLTEKPEADRKTLSDILIKEEPLFVAGEHSLYYLDDTYGKWYIGADFLVPFRTESAAEKYADKYGLEVQNMSSETDECYGVSTGTIIVPIADDCDGFDELIQETEVEEHYYKSVKIVRGEISSFKKSEIFSMQ